MDNDEFVVKVECIESTKGDECERDVYQIGNMSIEIIARGPSCCGKTISRDTMRLALKDMWEEAEY